MTYMELLLIQRDFSIPDSSHNNIIYNMLYIYIDIDIKFFIYLYLVICISSLLPFICKTEKVLKVERWDFFIHLMYVNILCFL